MICADCAKKKPTWASLNLGKLSTKVETMNTELGEASCIHYLISKHNNQDIVYLKLEDHPLPQVC